MGSGVAYAFWRRCEDKRLELGWTKSTLAEQTGLPRSTYNDLPDTTRPPLPRIVHALADALGIDRTEAEQLAGLRPHAAGQVSGVREAIRASDTLTDRAKSIMLSLYDELATDTVRRSATQDRHPSIGGDRTDDAQRAI